jgi:ATP-dependent Clp protease ATP-binding subunit ClpA
VSLFLSPEPQSNFHQAPLTGRVSAYLPFLHFSPGEQAVIVHKYLLELSRKVRDPVKLSDEQDERLLGNVKLRIKRDALVSRTVAETEYHADLGARSLITAVSDMVENELVEAYLDVDAGIEESSEMTEFVVDVSGGEIVVRAVE